MDTSKQMSNDKSEKEKKKEREKKEKIDEGPAQLTGPGGAHS